MCVATFLLLGYALSIQYLRYAAIFHFRLAHLHAFSPTGRQILYNRYALSGLHTSLVYSTSHFWAMWLNGFCVSHVLPFCYVFGCSVFHLSYHLLQGLMVRQHKTTARPSHVQLL